jgi:two-component system phosphate regulon response regulator OmpR
MDMADPQSQLLNDRPHILVVDDDKRICTLVSRYLKEHGFIVMSAESAAAARQMIEHFAFDALIVDVMMPGETGLEFTQFVQERFRMPVLLLTALGEAKDRITGFEAGADDYLPKPFEPRELVLRLNAILRRTVKKTEMSGGFKVGRWVFEHGYEELRDGDQVVKLTSVETKLLKALAARGGAAMTREELAKACGVDAGERTIDVQVTRLRRKIEEDTKTPRILQTVRGKGYLLRVEDL